MLIFFCVLPATYSCSIWIIFRQKLPCSVRRWHGLCVFFAPFIFPQVCLQTAAWRFYRENWHGSVTIRGKHSVPRSSGRFLLNPGRCCAAVYRLSYTEVTGWILNTYVLVAATDHIQPKLSGYTSSWCIVFFYNVQYTSRGARLYISSVISKSSITFSISW